MQILTVKATKRLLLLIKFILLSVLLLIKKFIFICTLKKLQSEVFFFEQTVRPQFQWLKAYFLKEIALSSVKS
jgi:hypothetical protein